MMKLTVTSFPEKGMDLEAVPAEGGLEAEVVRILPFGLRVRVPGHPLERSYTLEDFVSLLVEAGEGAEAAELLAVFGRTIPSVTIERAVAAARRFVS